MINKWIVLSLLTLMALVIFIGYIILRLDGYKIGGTYK